MDARHVHRRLAEFYSTLDLACEIPVTMAAGGVTLFLKRVFSGEDAFWRAVESIQNLKGRYTTDEELIDRVAELVKRDPRIFLILAHLHRQLRFTNLELIHFFFDRNEIHKIEYYERLLETDPVFRKQFENTYGSKKWNSYISTGDLGSDEAARLATFKKVVAGYTGSEKECWPLWRARIENDATVSRRIAEFVVRNEDLKKLIESDTVRSSLERSLRTVNVELIKRERGEYASRKVREILENSGFVFKPYDRISDVEDLEAFLKTQNTLRSEPRYVYTMEKLWRKEDKRFDFVLIANNRIQFVVETNYFTTSMSKIREVVRHFMELKKACRGKYRLIYITDGMGWFGLVKNIREMLQFEIREHEVEPSSIPFLMNLELFRRKMEKIKAEMLRE
ncbi:MAG: DpnII family type II restriction endonuclease [Thermoproteota archaeon]